MTRYSFDASAILAILGREPGGDQASAALESGECRISTVNLPEVASKLVLRGMAPAEVTEVCDDLALEVVPVDRGIALIAAQLAAAGKPLGLSIGDPRHGHPVPGGGGNRGPGLVGAA